MMTPCIVKTWAYWAASRKALLVEASCARISMASTPPIAKKTSAVTMNRLPTTVWFTADSRSSPRPDPQTASSS